MKGSSFERDSTKPKGKYIHQRRYFYAVVESYAEIRSSHPLAACNYDPDAEMQNHPLSFASIDHATDIERATEFALKGHPELEKVWFQLLNGDATINGFKSMQVIKLCAPIYESRGLEPWTYRRRVRQ